MKSSLLPFLLLLVCVSSIAQSQTTIFLKDGSKVKGAYLVNDSTGFVMVISEDNGYHYYLKSQVVRIEKDSTRHHKNRYTQKAKGYLCNIEIGSNDILSTKGAYNTLLFSLNVKNSYLISPIASTGGAIAIELGTNCIEMLSIYTDNKIYLIKSDVSPFIDLSLGYNVMISGSAGTVGGYYNIPTSFSNGMMVNPSFGVRVVTGKRVALTASIGTNYIISTIQ